MQTYFVCLFTLSSDSIRTLITLMFNNVEMSLQDFYSTCRKNRKWLTTMSGNQEQYQVSLGLARYLVRLWSGSGQALSGTPRSFKTLTMPDDTWESIFNFCDRLCLTVVRVHAVINLEGSLLCIRWNGSLVLALYFVCLFSVSSDGLRILITLIVFNNVEEFLQDASHFYSTQHPTAQKSMFAKFILDYCVLKSCQGSCRH